MCFLGGFLVFSFFLQRRVQSANSEICRSTVWYNDDLYSFVITNWLLAQRENHFSGKAFKWSFRQQYRVLLTATTIILCGFWQYIPFSTTTVSLCNDTYSHLLAKTFWYDTQTDFNRCVCKKCLQWRSVLINIFLLTPSFYTSRHRQYTTILLLTL